MKTQRILPTLFAGLVLSAGFALPLSAAKVKTDNVTVNFQDPERFTDAGDRHTTQTSTAHLDELRDYVQKTAAPLLPAGTKLSITFLDLDLAGQIRPDHDNIRVMTGTTAPHAHIKFQLLGADGRPVKEGERRLSDIDYQNSTRTHGRDDSLFYDKQMLKDWLEKEFKNS
jgi:DUF3016 family protein